MSDPRSNDDEVICPKCVHQFRAIPVNVQHALAARDAEIEQWKVLVEKAHDAGVESMAKELRRVLDGEPCLASNPPELAEVARLRQDAARYRWLRARCNHDYPVRVGASGVVANMPYRGNACHYPVDDDLDAEIDAALSATPAHQCR
jgi:hypothetical protein